MKLRIIVMVVAAGLGFTGTCVAEMPPELHPVMCLPAAVAYQSTFSQAGRIEKLEWRSQQGTQWEITDGVLRGRPSTPEYQAARPDHKGLEPRVAALQTPTEFIASLSVRFTAGAETEIVPFVEFGHHNARIKFSQNGVRLLGNHETVVLAASNEIQYQVGEWYHLLAEQRGDEFVVQFANGPTLYGKHPSLAEAVTSGAAGLGVAGPRAGTVEIDDVTFWTVKPLVNPQWEQTRAGLPQPAAIEASGG